MLFEFWPSFDQSKIQKALCTNLENNPIYIEVFGLLDSKYRSVNQLDIRMLINTKLRHTCDFKQALSVGLNSWFILLQIWIMVE